MYLTTSLLDSSHLDLNMPFTPVSKERFGPFLVGNIGGMIKGLNGQVSDAWFLTIFSRSATINVDKAVFADIVTTVVGTRA